MAGNQLTVNSKIQCPHGGTVTLATSNTLVFADGALVLLESDVHPVAGCSFTVGSKPSPCIRVKWSKGSTNVTVNDTATLVKDSKGECLNAENTIQGVALIVNTQLKTSAQ